MASTLKNTAGWSSPVAREAHNLEVVGSNPAPATLARHLLDPVIGGLFSLSERQTALPASAVRPVFKTYS